MTEIANHVRRCVKGCTPSACAAIVWFLFYLASAAAVAQSDIAHVDALKSQLSDSANAARRSEILDQILTARRQLIAVHPDDPRRAVWLADQASDLFFESMQNDGLALTVLFGRPSAPQRERARGLVQEMFDSASAAEATIGKAILEMEAQPGFQSDAALQDRRRDLADVQRDRRIPFLYGVSAVLQAQLNVSDANEKRRLYTASDRRLAPLTTTLQSSAAGQARLYDGLSKAMLGEFDAAESLFAAIAQESESLPNLVFAARMGGVINRAARGGPAAGLEALDSIQPRYLDRASAGDLFYRVLIADQRFELQALIARQNQGEQAASAFAKAFESYTNLLQSDLGSSREAIRSIISGRISDAVAQYADALPALDQLPDIVTVACAERLAEQSETRPQAIEMLETALRNRRLDSAAAPAALFALARALHEAGHKLFAAQRLTELGEKFPSDPHAQRAIEAAVTIASELHRAAPQDAEAAAALRHGLDVLIAGYPNLPTIDRWRYEAARLALDENRFDDAQMILKKITPDASQWLDGQYMHAAVIRAEASYAGDESNRQRLYQDVLSAIDRVEPILQAAVNGKLDPARAKSIHDYLAMLRVYRAEAQLNLHQPTLALATLAEMTDAQASHAVQAEQLRVQLAANAALGKPEDSLRAIAGFVRDSPDAAGPVLLPLLQFMQHDVQALIDSGREDQARQLAERTLLPAAQLVQQWLEGSASIDGASRTSFRRRIADAMRLSGQYSDALASYDSLLRDAPADAELLLGKAETLFHSGGDQRLADAMSIYKRIAAGGSSSSFSGAEGGDAFWLAQLRMLQILDRVNRNTDQILPRIEQLRQQDRTLGGDRYQRDFETLRRKYSSQ